MAITTNYKRNATGERLATFKLTVRLSAEEIATLLMVETSACYDGHGEDDEATPVPVNEAAIRRAIMDTFWSGLETASYKVGDNNAEDRCDEVKADVISKVFDGREFSDS